MSDFLRHLSERALAPAAGIRPYLPSVFEPLPTADGFMLASDAVSLLPDDRPTLSSPHAAPASRLDGVPGVPAPLPAPSAADFGNHRALERPLASRGSSDGLAPVLRRDDGAASAAASESSAPRDVDAPPPPTRPATGPPTSAVAPIAPVVEWPRLTERRLAIETNTDDLAGGESLRARPVSPRPTDDAGVRAVPPIVSNVVQARPDGVANAPQAPVAWELVPPAAPRSVPAVTVAGEPAARTHVQRANAIRPLIATRVPSHASSPTAESAPTIHVTIGRVEVRATSAPAALPRSRPAAPSAMSLAEYLTRRESGKTR